MLAREYKLKGGESQYWIVADAIRAFQFVLNQGQREGV